MRAIKFRGMDLQGRWFYGNLAVITTDKASVLRGYYISNSVGLPFAYPVSPKTIGQLTGLKDCKGTHIHEGDILRWNETGYVASVRYEGGWFVVGECGEPIMTYVQEAIDDKEFDTKNDCRNSEVIGNIHEHAHLLDK